MKEDLKVSVKTSRIGKVTEPMKAIIGNRDIQSPKKDQVLIKIKSSAICGSDIHIFKGKHPSAPLPVTIGHEFSGDVVEVGEDVTNVSVGDRVTVEPCIVCGTCDACCRGDYGYCENISFTYRNGDGAMADYILINEPYVYKLPEYLTYDTGALIEPLSVATHAVRRADIRLGETVLVIGAGAIGMLIASICKKSGAAEVIIADFSDERLAAAKKLGATITINSGKTNLEDEIRRITNGKGVDKSFECVGLEASFLQAMMTLKKNGLATVIGIFENPQINIPASRFVTHEIKIQGAQGYCWDFPIALKVARELDLELLITHHFPLDDIQKALETCLDRKSGSIKVLLHP
jgi:2-desacetyl-2-hydroxyethyl bacteriochlorophyllide A dehydrogenase